MFGMHWPATWLLNTHLVQVKLRDTITILNRRFPLVNQISTSRPFMYHVAILSSLLSFTDCLST